MPEVTWHLLETSGLYEVLKRSIRELTSLSSADRGVSTSAVCYNYFTYNGVCYRYTILLLAILIEDVFLIEGYICEVGKFELTDPGFASVLSIMMVKLTSPAGNSLGCSWSSYSMATGH